MVLSYPGRLLALCAQVEKSAAELCELLDIEQVPMSLQLTRLRPARRGADQSMFGVRKSGVIRTEEIFQAGSLQIGGYPHS